MTKQKRYYWVGNTSGLVWSLTQKCPVTNPPDRLKYLGYTEDFMWPMKLNTGRILYKNPAHARSRQGKKRRLLTNRS